MYCQIKFKKIENQEDRTERNETNEMKWKCLKYIRRK